MRRTSGSVFLPTGFPVPRTIPGTHEMLNKYLLEVRSTPMWLYVKGYGPCWGRWYLRQRWYQGGDRYLSFSQWKMLERKGHLRKKDRRKQKTSGAKMCVGTAAFSSRMGSWESSGRGEAVKVWTGEGYENPVCTAIGCRGKTLWSLCRHSFGPN